MDMNIYISSYIFIIFLLQLKCILAKVYMDVTIDINKNANNPRKKHFIVNKDIVSIGPPGFTEHIYEQSDLFNVTNFYFGRKKLEEGNKELTAKAVEKIGVFWKYETPVLLFIKHSDKNYQLYEYYKLVKQKYWVKVKLTEEQKKHLPLSGNDLTSLLDEILDDLGEIPEDKPLPGIGAFYNIPLLLPFLLPILYFILQF